MFDLRIKQKKDGLIYWRASFNSRAELDHWILIDEKSRPQIDGGYEYEIEDKTEEINAKKLQFENDERQNRQAKRILRQTLKAIRQKQNLTQDDIRQAILAIAELVDE